MKIFSSITAIMEDLGAIGKDSLNKVQGFKYRGIDDVMNHLHPLLAKHKVFVVPQVIEQTREERQTAKGGNLIYSICKIKYTFYAEDGSNVEAIVVGEGMDSGDKATNKAMAIALKYACFQVFCIPTEEMGKDDPDGHTPEPTVKKGSLSTKQIQRLYAIANSKGHNQEKVKVLISKKYGLTSTEELTKAQYDEVVKGYEGL